MTRRQLLPENTDLPITTVLPEVLKALSDRSAAVLVAPPGTGKTSLVPLALADACDGRVLVAEPRRIATRAAAARMAELSRTRLGQEIGYTVRGDRRVSDRTRVEVVTTGVLVRRIHNDPELSGVTAVIIDECHERHLDTDLACAFLTDVRANLRDDLRLLATSATAQAEPLARMLGGGVPAPVITAEAALHPMTILWRPSARQINVSGIRVEPAFLRHVAGVIEEALAQHNGDVLVFLPGAAEIERVARLLGHRADVDVLRLHGRQSAADQDASLRAGDRRRIVLATAVAESSLTVPAVRIVVDAGLSRQPRMDHGRGMGSLVTVAASKDAATQRAGRAARLGPGVVYRCWSQAEHDRRAAQAPPEIATADLTGFMLQLAAWGTPEGKGLPLLDRPGDGPARAAVSTLQALRAVDETGKVTSRGTRLAAAGTHPRLAKALLDGAEEVGSRRAAELVAVLTQSGPLGDDDVVAAWRRLRGGGGPETARWRQEVARLRATVPDVKGRNGIADDAAAATVVGLAYPEWVARLRPGQQQEYLLASGTAARLKTGSPLTGNTWLTVAEAARQPGEAVATIRSAAALDERSALAIGTDLITTGEEVGWRDGDIQAHRVTRLGAIVLSRSRLENPAAAEVAAALRDGFADEGLALLNITPAAERLRQRIAACRAAFGAPWPDVSLTWLRDNAAAWLGPMLGSVRRRDDLKRIDVAAALRSLLDWRQSAELDRLVPTHCEIPSGARPLIDYSDPSAPVVRAKVQEFFGSDTTPTVADGRIPVVVHLLSPAGRPAAVTSDLASFWRQGYPQVRSELRGRYPKHPWPQDPMTERPTARTKRRR